MENNNKNIILNEIFSSKKFVIATISISSLILLLLVFKLGVFVGFEKAKFSYRWNDNYSKNFDGPRDPFFMRENGGMPMMDSRGLFGSIIKIDTDSLTIKDKDETEKVVIVNDKTVIKEFQKDLKIADLKVDEKIVIIGEPNASGQVEARLIRILPEPISAKNNK